MGLDLNAIGADFGVALERDATPDLLGGLLLALPLDLAFERGPAIRDHDLDDFKGTWEPALGYGLGARDAFRSDSASCSSVAFLTNPQVSPRAAISSAVRRLPPQHVKLMTQNRVFSLKRSPRPERSEQRQPN
jgi:hypothetical protein